jgi:uroporphyrin-III C-methyltransferase
MARKHAGEIASKLIEAGRAPSEPAAIVSNASFADQATRTTTLSGLGAAAAEAKTPAVIVIGENVKLAAGLDWLGASLRGRRLDPDPLKTEGLRSTG